MNIVTIHGDRATIFGRLENRAKRGATSADLRLYQNQERKLLIEGFSVQRIDDLGTRPGQHRCHIGWRYVAMKNCYAYDLLQLAAENNAKLKQQLDNPNQEPCIAPYDHSVGDFEH